MSDPLTPETTNDGTLARELFFCYSRISYRAGDTTYALNAFPRWCLSAAYLQVHSQYSFSVRTFYSHQLPAQPNSGFLSDLADALGFGYGRRSARPVLATSDAQHMVHVLLQNREPTNLSMSKHHDVERLVQLMTTYYGRQHAYRESYYSKYWLENKQLAPNIAVYCETPAVDWSLDPRNERLDFDHNHALRLRVLNVIGFGFDDPKQPDFQRFRNERGSVALTSAIRSVFEKILACVVYFQDKSHPITWMHVPEFGCGEMAGGQRGRANEVNVIFNWMWHEFEPRWRAAGAHATRAHIYKDGSFSDNTLRPFPVWQEYARNAALHGGLDNRLFVNAWDPHTLVGNANFGDASMDGYYGRSTAMALLCWPLTNGNMPARDRMHLVDAAFLPATTTSAPTRGTEEAEAIARVVRATGVTEHEARRILFGDEALAPPFADDQYAAFSSYQAI